MPHQARGTGRFAVAHAVLFVLVFATAFLYRFNTLGGALGGFGNDEFGYLARARQIQAGDVPFRDFNDPGWFLTDYLAAAAQWVGGYNLRSEAVLTIGMLSLGTAVAFLLARRVSGSVPAALLAVALLVAVEPRHYNYPKIVLYAVGLWLAWAYADRPGRLRLVALATLVPLAFLFRHDHLVYLGALALLTVALVHRASMREAARAAMTLGGVVVAGVVPFLVFLTLSGGVGEYFRSALLYVTRDAERTSFSFPRFALDVSQPMVALTRSPRGGEIHVNVRWEPIPDDQRGDRESRYQLARGQQQDGATWNYVLEDASSANIKALVSDPLVSDTHGLDRTNFRVEGQELRLQSQLDTVANGTTYLYYFFLLLPALGGAMLYRLRRTTSHPRAVTSLEHMVPLFVLAAMLNVTFLSRGSTNIRIADVGVTAAVILAWIIAALASQDGRRMLPNRAVRAVAHAGAVAVLAAAFLAANGLMDWWRHGREAYYASGPLHAATRMAEVWDALGIPPTAFSKDEEQPRLLRVASYLNACTDSTDRVFVLGNYPELYYFSDRPFAGGHAWLLPKYYTDDTDETRIVARLRRARVPIVVTETASEYEEEYRPVFERVHAYLEDEYVHAGEVDAGGPRPLRVLVRAGLEPTGQYEELGLPCFGAARVARSR
jgi:hypothetical protein